MATASLFDLAIERENQRLQDTADKSAIFDKLEAEYAKENKIDLNTTTIEEFIFTKERKSREVEAANMQRVMNPHLEAADALLNMITGSAAFAVAGGSVVSRAYLDNAQNQWNKLLGQPPKVTQDSKYWLDLIGRAENAAADITWQPRTQGGDIAAKISSFVFALGGKYGDFVDKVAELEGVPPERRALIKKAGELVGQISLGAATPALKLPSRVQTKRFQKAVAEKNIPAVEAEATKILNNAELTKVAQDINAKATGTSTTTINTPRGSATVTNDPLAPPKDFVDILQADKTATSAPLSSAAETVSSPAVSPEVVSDAPVASGSAGASPVPEIDLTGMGKAIGDNYRSMLWDRFQNGLTTTADGTQNMSLQVAQRLHRAGIEITPEKLSQIASEVDVLQTQVRTSITDPAQRQAAYKTYYEQLLEREAAAAKAAAAPEATPFDPESTALGINTDLSRAAQMEGAVSPEVATVTTPAPEAAQLRGGTTPSLTSELQAASITALDDAAAAPVRTAALLEIKAAAKQGLKSNQKISDGLRALGFDEAQITALEPKLKNVRSRGKKAAEKPIAEQPAATEPAAEAPALAKVTYRTGGSLADIENSLRDATPSSVDFDAPQRSPLHIRATNGKPDSVLINDSGLNVLTSAADVQKLVDTGRMSPDIAEATMNNLRNQAKISGVPLEQAHLYAGEQLLTRAAEIAKANNLQLMRAKRVKGETIYEIVPDDAINAMLKLEKATDIERPPVSAKEADAYVKHKETSVEDAAVEMIQEALANRRDIRDLLPPGISERFGELFDSGTKALEGSEIRNIRDIFNDLSDLLGGQDQTTLGMFPMLTPTPRQIAAWNRLKADASRIGNDLVELLNRFPGAAANIPLFEQYSKRISSTAPAKGVNPRNMALDPNSPSKVVKHRVISKGKNAAPLFDDEVVGIQTAKKISEAVFGFLELPHRKMKEAGVYDLIMEAHNTSQQQVNRAMTALNKDLNQMSKEFNLESRRRVGAYGYAQDALGQKINAKNGVATPVLTPREMSLYNALRGVYDDFLIRINEARAAIGQDPIQPLPNYMTHLRTFSVMEKLGLTGNLIRANASTINTAFIQHATTNFPYARQRKKATYTAEYDVFKLMQAYSSSATKQIHMAPFIAKIHELIDTKLPDPKTGNFTWQLKDHNPGLYTVMRNWNDFLATGSNFKWPAKIEAPIRALSSNMVFSLLSGGVRSALIQPTTLRNTYQAIGLEYTLKGIAGSFEDIATSGKNRKFLLENSKLLDSRKMDAVYNDVTSAIIGRNPGDFLRAIAEGRVGEVQGAVSRVGLKLLEAMDMEAAYASMHGAYRFATEKLKMTPERAIQYADDLLLRTQGSAMPGHLAPIQRSVAGRAFTQFQTFVITDWNFLTRDVLGIKNPDAIANKNPNQVVPQIVKNIARFAAATTALNILYENVLAIQSPFPTPIRDVQRGIERGDNVMQLAGVLASTAVEPLPIIGATRYGKGIGGPIIETGRELTRAYREDPLAPSRLEATSKFAGVPFVQQIGKTQRAMERGENFWKSLTGWYSDEQQASKSGRRNRARRRAARSVD